jgi:citrate lyase subunit beta/citryl-CoA lyase
MSDITLARTFLFVPGDRPDRFGKAAASEADIVILDLEDAVAADRKLEAREHVRAWLDQRHKAVVRVNAADTPWHADDIGMVAGSPGAVAVMVPKAEDPGRIESLSRSLPAGMGIVPLIETATGLLGATAICALGSVARPAFGSVDLAAQLGVDHNAHHALHHMRSALVLAAAAAGCGAPVDGVTTSLADDSRLLADLEHAIALGFTAKLCIHPRQVAIANQRLTPSEADVEWAQQVIAAAQDGAVTVRDGQMIDRPVVLRAQAVVARASSTRQEGQAF